MRVEFCFYTVYFHHHQYRDHHHRYYYYYYHILTLIKYVCRWLFYQHPEYNTYETGYVHWSYGLDYQDPMNDYIHDQVR